MTSSREQPRALLLGQLTGEAREHRVIYKQSVEYVVRSSIAGGVAGSAAKTLIAPLDRIKILFQTSNPDFLKYRGTLGGFLRALRQIWRDDGIFGLFQGHSVTLLRIFPYAAIKFVAYEQIRTLFIPSDEYETAVRRFLSGSLSGLSSVFFTYPLDLARVRMAFDTGEHLLHRGRLLSTVKSIYHEAPTFHTGDPGWLRWLRLVLPQPIVNISNFYRGFAPTIMGMIPYAGVSFYTHDLIHDLFRSHIFQGYTVQSRKRTAAVVRGSLLNSRDSRAPLRAWAQLCAGGFAGMFSQTAAYPFEIIRRRMQVGGVVNDGQFLSFKHTAKIIFKESGLRGFFVGLSIGYIKVIPMLACSFYVYERAKVLLRI